MRTQHECDQQPCGRIADEVRPHVPEAVGTYLWTRDDKDEGRELATLDPTHLVFVLINSLKELAGKNSDLEARLAALEAANA